MELIFDEGGINPVSSSPHMDTQLTQLWSSFFPSDPWSCLPQIMSPHGLSPGFLVCSTGFKEAGIKY